MRAANLVRGISQMESICRCPMMSLPKLGRPGEACRFKYAQPAQTLPDRRPTSPPRSQPLQLCRILEQLDDSLQQPPGTATVQAPMVEAKGHLRLSSGYELLLLLIPH